MNKDNSFTLKIDRSMVKEESLKKFTVNILLSDDFTETPSRSSISISIRFIQLKIKVIDFSFKNKLKVKKQEPVRTQ